MAKITEIKLDKERHLKYGFNALVELEKTINRPLSELDEGLSMSDLRALLYVGLKWEDTNLTEESVGDLMDDGMENNEGGLEYIGKTVGTAVAKSLGTAKFPSE